MRNLKKSGSRITGSLSLHSANHGVGSTDHFSWIIF